MEHRDSERLRYLRWQQTPDPHAHIRHRVRQGCGDTVILYVLN
jgi:hypothetical protein